jgi:hypothetical protein
MQQPFDLFDVVLAGGIGFALGVAWKLYESYAMPRSPRRRRRTRKADR